VPVPNEQWKTPDDGQRNCPKHVELRTKIKIEISASVGFIVKKYICRFNSYRAVNTLRLAYGKK
jgi:hypothetical protein